MSVPNQPGSQPKQYQWDSNADELANIFRKVVQEVLPGLLQQAFLQQTEVLKAMLQQSMPVGDRTLEEPRFAQPPTLVQASTSMLDRSHVSTLTTTAAQSSCWESMKSNGSIGFTVSVDDLLGKKDDPQVLSEGLAGVDIAPSDHGAKQRRGSVLHSEVVLDTCLDATEREVMRVLRDRDVNVEFRDFQIRENKKEFTYGSPLTIAILRKQQGLASWLLESRADPDSTYGFLAGARQMYWTGPCSFAAVSTGDLPLLQKLMACRADLAATASNGANLLWQAVYLNKTPFVTYLIEKRCALEAKAESQDTKDKFHTPLHVAAREGRAGILRELLLAKASLAVHDGVPGLDEFDYRISKRTSGLDQTLRRFRSQDVLLSMAQENTSPLREAILQGHTECAQLLIENGADLFDDNQCLDLALESNNPATVAAVAAGLAKSPGMLDKLTLASWIRFLICPGIAPHLILEAVFQPKKILVWDVNEETGIKCRREFNAAFFLKASEGRSAIGPHASHLRQLFNERNAPSQDVQVFLDKLTPRRPESKSCVFGPAHFFMCHVPGIHDHLHVLAALAVIKDDAVFTGPFARAIMDTAATKSLPFRLASIMIEFVEVLSLVALNSTLKNRIAHVLHLIFGFALAAFVANLGLLLLIGVGYMTQHTFSRIPFRFSSRVCTLLLSTLVLVATYALWLSSYTDASLRACLGLVVFLRWMQSIYNLCQFKYIGLRVLPITSTMHRIGPFVVLTVVCILGIANLWLATGLDQSPWETVMSTYVLVVLGEFWNSKSMKEMPAGVGRVIMELTLAFTSFFMTVSLMNLYIAILCNAYIECVAKRQRLFQHFRDIRIMDARAGQLGFKYLTQRKAAVHVLSKDRAALELNASLSESSSSEYLWICLQSDRAKD